MADNENQASQRQDDHKMEDHNRAKRGLEKVAGRGSDGKDEFEEMLRKAQKAECTCSGEAQNLIQSAERGCLGCCLAFIEQAGERDENDFGKTALMKAAGKGHVGVARILAQKEAGMQDHNGGTALMRAAENGNMEIAKLLIPQEAKVQTQAGRTALMLAAKGGQLGAVKLLLPLEGGIKTKTGQNASDFARSVNDPELWRLFPEDIPEDDIIQLKKAHAAVCSCKGKSQDLFQAADNGCLRCCARYMDKAGTAAWDNVTALMHAVLYGRADCARLLLSREAGTRSSRGETALRYAVKNLDSECAALLLASEKEAEDVPVQMLAAFKGDARTLLAMRNAWEETLYEKVTILHFALAGGDERCVQLLVREEEMRRFFGRKDFCFCFVKGDPSEAIKAALPGLLRNNGKAFAACFASLLFNGNARSARALVPFTTSILNGEVESQLSECENVQLIACFLRLAKNVGFVFGRKTILDLDAKLRQELSDLISLNPIYSKQLELARKQIEKNATNSLWRQQAMDLPDSKQFSAREARAEASLNRLVMLEARDVSWKAIHLGRSARHASIHALREKVGLNAAAIKSAIRYAKLQLRKMMTE